MLQFPAGADWIMRTNHDQLSSPPPRAPPPRSAGGCAAPAAGLPSIAPGAQRSGLGGWEGGAGEEEGEEEDMCNDTIQSLCDIYIPCPRFASTSVTVRV